MNILVTGANGFLGSAVVRSALRAGHHVKAMVRPGRALTGYAWDAELNAVTCAAALEDSGELLAVLGDVEAVIHIAAAKSGDYAYQYANTVETTQALLNSMRKAGIQRLIGIGSFAVFDYKTPQAGDLLHADSAMEPQPDRRDAYTQTKLLQEHCFDAFAELGGQVTVLRPGIIYGANQLWQFCLGHSLANKVWLRIGQDTKELPWTYVENCADAIVAALTAPASVGASMNIVDDDRPGRKEFIAKLNAWPELRKHIVPMPWRLLYVSAWMISLINDNIFRRRLPVPGLFRPEVLNVRFKPLCYSNERAKRLLEWEPRFNADTAIQKSLTTTNNKP